MTNMSKRKWMALSGALLIVLLAVGLCLHICLSPGGEEGNLIANGGFEEASGILPEDWTIGRWYWDEGVSYLSLSDKAYAGQWSVCVENVEENDARFEQTISVKPNTWYRISCMICAEGCDEASGGAGISVKDTFVTSEYVYDTAGEWAEAVLYGKTASDQKSITILCRVGGYGALNTGKAWFDEVSVERIDALPAGETGHSLEEQMGSSSAVEDDEAETGMSFALLLLLSLLFILLSAALGWLCHIKKPNKALAGKIFAGALALGLIVRVVLALSVRGFDVDMNCFEGWAERIFTKGFHFYDDWCDYPPGYILLLWPIGALRVLLGIGYDTPAHWLLIKLLPIICDVLIAMVLSSLSRKRLGDAGAAWVGAAYLVNPAVIFNSAVWGQVDCVLALLLLLSVSRAVSRHWKSALAIFACAVLAKPQALMFAPIGLAMLIVEAVRDRENRREAIKEMALGAAAALGIVLLAALPFALAQGENPVSWLVSLYAGTLSEYNYITVNACNFYVLLGMNWRALADAGLWSSLSWAAYVLAFGLAIWFYVKSGDRSTVFMLCAMALSIIFAFGAKMHERYLYPAIALLFAAYAVDRDWRLLGTALALSVSVFLNGALVLNDQWLMNSRASSVLVALIQTAAAPVLVWTGWDICLRRRYLSVDRLIEREKSRGGDSVPSAGKTPILRRDKYRLNMKKADYIIMTAVTLAYAVLAFTNLGSMKAPQTAWTSSASGESVTFELEDVSSFHMTYYGGICNSTFTVSFSEDGESWTEEALAEYDQGQIFRWLWFAPQEINESGKFTALESGYPLKTARYIRITAQKAGLVLHEVAFLSEEGEVLPIAGVTSAGADETRGMDAALLADEQDTVPEHPSYYNSTYFDEIYHARTGYEFANGLNPYETTHPPLGKVLIMLGIKIFGMTPFGWRFMGALLGVLMLPIMYLLGKQLFKKTGYAAVGMLLLALDAMHFTQTRIATIDTYGVFFILLMYLFMFRYCQMNFFADDFKKTLIPLGLSGLFMGLGIASKWICIYAGAGLAVLFFATLIRRYIEHVRALREGDQGAEYDRAREKFWRYAIKTCLFCVVMFVIVPVLIYYFSYYWYMKPTGGLSLERVWRAQVSMFNYHKGLTGDTHYFRSPWYEWPLIIKPMWYYSGTEFMPEGYISSISCMGNPAVWWTGLAALIFVAAQSAVHGVRIITARLRGEAAMRVNRTRAFILLGFAAQYLPWVLVPRSTFIYHYFASVPFIILATVSALKTMARYSRRRARAAACVLLFAALVLFIAFYPLESGLPTLRAYAQYLRWFNWYNY